MNWEERYKERFYSRVPGWIDGTEEFHLLCASKIQPKAKILEIGSGPSNPTSRFLATLGEVHGLDPDSAVLSNDALTNAAVLDGRRFPFESASFDHCVSNYVVEHLAEPVHHLAEVKRVLKPGGSYIFRTPNRLHYVTLIARLTPHWFHRAVSNRVRGLPSSAHDPYPTVYAMNSGPAIRRAADCTGMRVELIRYVEKEPSYGKFAPPAYLAFMLYERIVNSSDLFAQARANVFVVLRS